ncbi:MAG TPA: peptidase domain-containing ABC transporter [Chryseosolibacter sp.]
MKKKFPFFRQLESIDCGPTCLQMITAYYGRTISLQHLKDKCDITREGVSMLGLSNAAESMGFRTRGVLLTYDALVSNVDLPAILHWNQNHYVVLYAADKNSARVADPKLGLVKLTRREIINGWQGETYLESGAEGKGKALIITPTPQFFSDNDTEVKRPTLDLYQYLVPHKKLIWQLFAGLVIGTMLQLLAPFLMQSVVDVGINQNDINFIYLILIAQFALFCGQTFISILRSWMLLHISSRINISLLSDFLIKLLKLPVSFFDKRMTGDLFQRFSDHSRIESFLTASTLNTLFSILNLLVFGSILAYYKIDIFLFFIAASVVYVAWVVIFLKKRKEYDKRRFTYEVNNHNELINLIQGIEEIKLQNSEKRKRWNWENTRAKLFNISIKSHALNQYQEIGAGFINELKNIVISIMAATAVINGEMTLGMMIALQYIIGQLNAPVLQLISFIQTGQQAMMSLERFGEIHGQKEESEIMPGTLTNLPSDKSLYLNDTTFRYSDSQGNVLNGITLTIPANKITAIVGNSGSGKTTLLKLLLKFYNPLAGRISVGNLDFSAIEPKFWRRITGAVLQDGYIFPDTIANNIAISDDKPDRTKLIRAAMIANILEFVESQALGFETKIGNDGIGLSAGQKQRILIARAVYKDPEYLFFDEATNSLDANNESAIINNLNTFFEGRTVVVVAHRLSTVKNAHQILVMENGRIVEAGDHISLSRKQGAYYNLVKNQLELEA